MNSRDKIIDLILEKQLFVKEDFVNELIINHPFEKIIDTIENHASVYGQTFVSVFDIESDYLNVYDYFTRKHIDNLSHLPRVKGRNKKYPDCHSIIYTKEEAQRIRDIIAVISKPTTYITPNGNITINFDVDVMRNILDKCNIGEWFQDYLVEFFIRYEQLLIVQYLV